MRSVNERIADEIRRHAISLARYSEHERQSIFRMLNRLFGQLRNDLQDSDITTGRTRYQRRRLELLFKQVRSTIATSYEGIGKRTEAGLKSLAEIEGEWAVSMLNKSLGVKFLTMTPATAEQLAAIASDVLIEGAPSSEWWSRQSDKLLNNFKDQIRQGWTRGETLDQLMKRLTGGLDEDGNPYFDLRKGTRRGAEATIRTSVQAVANDARMRVYKDNADIIEGLQWVSTLDLRTTVECAAMDGLVWDLNGNPIGHGMTLDPPPRHWNCRSVLVPITKSFREMGIPIDEFPESTRASMDGQVPESQNFEKWIAGKPDSYADEVFGKGRAELWRQGKISVRDMVDQRGNPLTLEELRKQSSGPVAAPFVPAKSIKEAEEWAMAQGLVRHADYKGIDLEVANEWNKGIYENTRDIPGLKGELLSTGSAQQHYLRLYEMEVDSMFNFLQNHATRWAGKSVEEIRREAARLVTKRRVGKEWAFSTLDDRAKGIFINSKYGSTKGLPELKKELSHSVSSGFSPVGCDTLKSLVDHEMGHQIDAFLGVGNDSRVKELFSSLGKKDVIGVELSRYGKTNIAEFIAEGWAEYRNNPSPRPVAKQIGEIIMELASRRGVVK